MASTLGRTPYSEEDFYPAGRFPDVLVTKHRNSMVRMFFVSRSNASPLDMFVKYGAVGSNPACAVHFVLAGNGA